MRLLLACLLLVMTAFAGCFGGEGDTGDGGGSGDGPEAKITVLPGLEAPGGTEFTFDATGSAGGKAYFWNFGDGTTADQSVVKHTFPGDHGKFPVTLVVTDSKGTRGFDLVFVKVGAGENAAPVAAMTADALWVGSGTPITFTVNATDPDNDPLQYYWTISPAGAASGGGGGHAGHGGGGGNDTGGHAGHGAAATAAAGPCDTSPPAAECMEEKGDTFSKTFDTAGIYVYHCHPHPWMKQLVIVSNDGPTDAVGVDIDNFAFVDDVIRVGAGTNVTWTNKDPIPHTATEEAAHAGNPLPDTGNTVTWTPTEMGDFMVMAMVRDGKPYTGGKDYAVGEAMPMLTVRVTEEAPEGTVSWPHSGAYPSHVFVPPEAPDSFTHQFNFTGAMNLSLTWTSPVMAAAKVRMEIFSGTAAQGTPFENPEDTTGTLTIAKTLPAGAYTFRVVPVQGAQIEYDLVIDVVFDVKPPTGGGHAGH